MVSRWKPPLTSRLTSGFLKIPNHGSTPGILPYLSFTTFYFFLLAIDTLSGPLNYVWCTMKWRGHERARLILTLELAVVLPAAALVVLSVLHLRSIQRDRQVEAAIQRDFFQVLGYSEK